MISYFFRRETLWALKGTLIYETVILQDSGRPITDTLINVISRANKREEEVCFLAESLNLALDERHIPRIIYYTFALCRTRPKTHEASKKVAYSLIHCLEKNISSTGGGINTDFDIIYNEAAETLRRLRVKEVLPNLRGILKEEEKLNALPHVLKVIGHLGDKNDIPLVQRLLDYSCPAAYNISERRIRDCAKEALDELIKRV